jgi:hypothetical protein
MITTNCKHCGKLFTYALQGHEKLFCNKQCWNASRRVQVKKRVVKEKIVKEKIERICVNCESIFEIRKPKQKRCDVCLHKKVAPLYKLWCKCMECGSGSGEPCHDMDDKPLPIKEFCHGRRKLERAK